MLIGCFCFLLQIVLATLLGTSPLSTEAAASVKIFLRPTTRSACQRALAGRLLEDVRSFFCLAPSGDGGAGRGRRGDDLAGVMEE